MDSLQQLALDHVKRLAEDLGDEIISLNVTTTSENALTEIGKSASQMHVKSRDIARWIDAIKDQNN